MKIGKYDLYSVETSEFGLDGGAMFGIIPKPVWEKNLRIGQDVEDVPTPPKPIKPYRTIYNY